MQNVNFRCSNCSQLLAVQAQFLGAQVRCPHCQKVVSAPTTLPPSPEPAPPPKMPPPPLLESPAPPPPPPMLPTLPPSLPPTDQTFEYKAPEEHESIFSAATASDDLFGYSAQKIEMPTERIPSAPDNFLSPPAPRLELPPTLPPTIEPLENQGTLTYLPSDQTQPSGANHEVEAPRPPDPLPWTPPQLTDAPPAEDDAEPLRDPTTEAILARPRSRSGWHIALFIIPLISYSILATIAAALLWYKTQNKPPHPLEVMPDIDGEHPTNRGKPDRVPDPKGSMELPEQLKIRLGETIHLGELEVTAVKVTRGSIDMYEKDPKLAGPVEGDALKLYLHLKNVSPDLAFYPLDRYFTRFHREKKENDRAHFKFFNAKNEPYSYLRVGKEKFFGGPASFVDERRMRVKDRGHYANEFIIGQDLDKRLGPGQEMDTFICTDPENTDVDKALQKYAGELLTWRVQVRRGSVLVNDRRIPCQAVFGVQFKDSDITEEKKAD